MNGTYQCLESGANAKIAHAETASQYEYIKNLLPDVNDKKFFVGVRSVKILYYSKALTEILRELGASCTRPNSKTCFLHLLCNL